MLHLLLCLHSKHGRLEVKYVMMPSSNHSLNHFLICVSDFSAAECHLHQYCYIEEINHIVVLVIIIIKYFIIRQTINDEKVKTTM